MAGIDSLISNRVDAFANNPQALMQRYSMSQDLLDLLALQKLKQEKEAVARTLQMQMQAPQGTVKDQLEGQVMDMTRREVAQAAAPGLQQQGQRMVANQMQEAMGAGLPTQSAPALQGMAQGGIVGYAPGGRVSSGLGRVGEAEMDRTEAEVRAAEMIKEDPEILALMAMGAISPELVPLLARVGTRRNPLIRDAAKYGDDMPGMASLRPRVLDPRQGAAGTAAGLGALLATREQSPSMEDIGRGENALAGALNRLNTAPEGGATAVGTSGTPDQNIQVSRDALRRFDERRGAEENESNTLMDFFGRVGESEMDRVAADQQTVALIKENPEILALVAAGALAPEAAALRIAAGRYGPTVVRQLKNQLAKLVTKPNQTLRDIAQYGDDIAGASSLPTRVFDPVRTALLAATGAGAVAESGRDSQTGIGTGESALRDTLNRLNTTSEQPRSAPVSSGTPDQNIQISRDALRRFDERREAEAEAKTPMAPSVRPRTSSPGTPDRGRRFDKSREAEAGIAAIPTGMGQTQDDIAALTALTSGAQGPLRRTPTVVPAAPAAPAAIAQARPEISAPTEEGLAALFNNMTAPRQQAQAEERPQFRSRYEDRLAEIEAEKQDRMGALIEFLQAAGASGGTNLGATLMGGGSGLRARDERLRQQEMEALKEIIGEEQAQQMMDFRERDLAQQAQQAAEDRAFRLQLFGQEAGLRKELERMGIASAEKIAEINRGADLEVRNLVNSSVITQEQQANLRTYYSAISDQVGRMEEVVNDYTAPESMRNAVSIQLEKLLETKTALEEQLRKPVGLIGTSASQTPSYAGFSSRRTK